MTTTRLVTATDDGAGKTAIALGLGRLAQARDRRVGYMKPKGTRLRSVVGKVLDEDPMLAKDLFDIDADIATLEPVVYSPTFIEGAVRGEEDPAAIRSTVRERFETLSADRDLMLLEGATSLATGAAIDLTDPDLAALLDAEVLLVAAYGEPGDVDPVLDAADRLGDRLRGVFLNKVGDDAYDRVREEVVPFLAGRDVPVLGVLPRVRSLSGITVADFAADLGADVLTDAPTDGLIERLAVGAMGADAALAHLRRTSNAALITGGDRSEIHTVALEAPGVECLCLTGGFRPSGAVLGKAEERGVPVIAVEGDTLSTLERAEGIVTAGRTRSAGTVDRMRDLLADHADVDAAVGPE